MAVVLSNCDLTVTVRAHPWNRDSRGTPVPSSEDELTERGPFPGAVKEQPDASWSIRLDPRCWPLRAGDTITDGTRTWVAQPDPKLHEVPGVPDVDYVAVVGTLDPPRTP